MNRDVAYIDDKLKRLKKIWKGLPELRLGQILGNCVNYQQLYYLSDEDLLNIIERRYLTIAEKNIAEAKRKNAFGGARK